MSMMLVYVPPTAHAIRIWGLYLSFTSGVAEALPGVLGNRGTRAFISREQGNKGQILRGTGEQRQYWRTGNIRKQIFDFWGTGEQANLFQGNKGTGTPLGGPHSFSTASLRHFRS